MTVSRYHRQTLLPGVGDAGQRRLADASVMIVGCGALGSVSAEALCRAGVACGGGRLVIVDRDVVEATNLQRQTLFDEADAHAGTPKAEAAKHRLAAINSAVTIDAFVEDVDHRNIEALAGVARGSDSRGPRVDCIVDGTDNFATRFLLNDLAVKHAIPYCYGGAVGTAGSAMTILPRTPAGDAPWESVVPQETPPGATPPEKVPGTFSGGRGVGRDLSTADLTALLPEPPPPGSTPTCDTAGVLGPAVGLIANFQAAQCLKVLLGAWADVDRRLLQVDLWRNTMRRVDVSAFRDAGLDPATAAFDYLGGRHAERTTSLCGRNAVQVARRDALAPPGTAPRGAGIDFDALAARLAAHGPVKHSPLMLRARVRDAGEAYELSVFPDGRAIVRGTTDPARARGVYARYVGG